MKKETYIQMTGLLKSNQKMSKAVHIANKLLTGLVFISYPLLLVNLFFQKNLQLSRAIIVPLDAFIILTVVRHFLNFPRPYEVFETESVITKKTKGKSFPSRHVFSVFMIAMTYLAMCQYIWIGIVLFAVGALLAIVRVISGVHFPRDVIAGAICGIIAGICGFWVF